jgi:hypothetical protein
VKVRVGGATVEEEYDIAILHELIDAGLPEERWAELVTYEPRVDGRIIQQLKRNPTYAAVIELAVTGRKEKYRGVRFS